MHPNETPESRAFKEGKTCYEVANGTFEDTKSPYRRFSLLQAHKDLQAFSPRTFPGICCGWRLDAGYKFRGVHMVLDYESLREDTQGCGRPIRVYASELIVPETFVFPLHEAQVEKLALFKNQARLPSLPARDVLPFQSGGPEPKVRARRTYVTLERAIRFSKTVGCKGCEHIAEGVKHTDACHERFRKLLEVERFAKEAKASKSIPSTPGGVLFANGEAKDCVPAKPRSPSPATRGVAQSTQDRNHGGS